MTLQEIRNRYKHIPHSSVENPPINPRTGKPYHPFTLHWWRWFYGLDNDEKGRVAYTYEELKRKDWNWDKK